MGSVLSDWHKHEFCASSGFNGSVLKNSDGRIRNRFINARMFRIMPLSCMIHCYLLVNNVQSSVQAVCLHIQNL